MSAAMDRTGIGGGHNSGPCYILAEIDPDTLPRDPADCWGEVARRARAYERGESGWRTGQIQREIDEWGGDDG